MQLKNVKRKTICVLLSILHVCVLCIGIFIFTVPDTPEEIVLAVDNETETTAEIEYVPESSAEVYETESASSEESIMEPEETTAPECETTESIISYTFQYSGGKHNLNIRKGPSINDAIIGKIPPHEGGKVLELVDDEWALIAYHGITGYCSREWIVLTEQE